jgi:predicted RNA-binding protein YlqC (UPF0109 family)
MKEFLEFITQHLVDRPDLIRIDEKEQEGRVILRLEVGEEERGKVIGKHGRTAQALRTLLSAVAARSGRRAVLEIVQ